MIVKNIPIQLVSDFLAKNDKPYASKVILSDIEDYSVDELILAQWFKRYFPSGQANLLFVSAIKYVKKVCN